MKESNLQKTLDRKLNETEKKIDKQYADAMESVVRGNKATMNRIKALMNGEEKPPRWMTSERQQDAWRYKQLVKLLEESRLLEKAADAIKGAGLASVTQIKRLGVDTYKMAYQGVSEQLKE